MKNRKTLFSSLFIALFLCTIQSAFAATWYVSNAGNNANDGSSWATAKQTIMAAVTASASGDVINIQGGTYAEQVVIGNKSLSLVGSQNGGGRTIIVPPDFTLMTSYSLPTALVWNGAGKMSSTTVKPIVFANATSASTVINMKGIDIDGTSANMSEASTDIFVGLLYRYAQGTIGGSGADYIEVTDIKPTANTNSLNNTAGILFLTRSKPTLQYARVNNYRNIGIGIVGESTSSLQAIREEQPYPTIQDCIVTGENGGTTSASEDAIQAGILVANGGHGTIRRSHIHGNRSTNAGGLRLAYGLYFNDARTVLVGDNSTKTNGNIIHDNEMAIYVNVITTSLSASLYTFKNNNIVYNGGSPGLGTASGKVASYSVALASHTTYGVVRFSHASPFTQNLNMGQNAFGNAESDLFFSTSPAPWSANDYVVNQKYAFWTETTGDEITITNPLSAPVATNLSVNSSHAPSNGSGSPSVDVAYGYTKFEQLNKAVYAAQLLSVGTVPPQIDLATDVVENESVVITKPVKIIGSGSNCGNYTSVTLRSGVLEPTFWFYGLNTGAGNLDALNRQPRRDTLQKIRVLANDLQAASVDPAGPPAVLFTGSTAGTNAPLTPVLSFMSISSEFDGTTSPQAYSTSQSGSTTLSKRYAPLGAGPYNVRYTRRPENCNNLVADPNVIDYSDNTFLARFRFDNNIYVANCVQLNAAIAAAEGPDPTSIIVTEDIIGCDAIVNNTESIIMDVVPTKTANIHYLLNPGTGPGYGGGSRTICNFMAASPTLGGTHIASRVTVYPPACLQSAINLISDDPASVLVAADGSVSTIRPFLDVSPVTIGKRFDFRGATNATAHLGVPTAGDATYTGKFQLNSGTDINNLSGSLTSTRGSIFGSTDNQVDLTFSSSTLSNFGGGTGDAIEMALQLIGTSGSRRMELTTNNHLGETPTITKRAFINGLANRGTSVGNITLNGSGDCSNPSVLRNLSLANATVLTNADCIQTALGIADCSVYTQDIEGVGTNSTNGSGGTVNLSGVPFTQSFAISKSVTFLGKNSTSGTVTLRRGATVLSNSLDDFTNTVNLEQCTSFTGAANPSPQDGIAIANTGTGIVNIAGYGIASSGVTANGVWSFSNIDVNKDVDIRGNYHSTSATDLTCALLAGSSLPLINGARVEGSETVIGTFDGATLTVTDPIFKVTTSGPSIKGFTVRNVGSASQNAFVKVIGTSSNIEVNNNIVKGSVSAGNTVIGLVHDDNAGNKSNIDISNNHYATSSTSQNVVLLRRLRDGASATALTNNVVSGDFGVSTALEFADIVNTVTDGLTIRNNWVNASASSHGIHFWSTGANTLNGILVEQNQFRGGFVGLSLNTSDPTGSNLFTVRENYIKNNATGIRIDGNLTTVLVNQIFVNNNNLESNTAGINVNAITSNSAATTNMLDLRFNWWGSSLGPVKGTNVASAPSFAGSDSLNVIGHVPFTHSGAGISTIEDINGATHGRWMVYPAATTNADGNATCGWQYTDMMNAVLRVNSARNSLIGNFGNLATASTTAGNTSDQLFVLGPSTYNSTSFGYPSSAGHETYPIVYSQANQPSTIKGLTYPTINAGNTTGTIEVTSTYPVGFTVSDYIKHLSEAGTHTVLSFANNYGNTVKNNYMTTNTVSPSSYIGISMTGGTAAETHLVRDNRINLTDGGTGEAWPGSASVTTVASQPIAFTAIAFTGNASLSTVNVICNNIVAQSTSGSKGIVYTSSLAAAKAANIEANTISTLGTGVHYTFSGSYGFAENVTTKENYIVNGIRGVLFSGSFVPMTTNTMFVNNNNLSGNSTAGVDVAATTSNTVSTTNMLDLRFNWWGSNLGPVKGTNVAAAPSFAGSDSLNIIGHVPFTHAGTSKIEDAAASAYGRWMVYPSATVATDANGLSCGWNYTHMMPSVLRVNAAGNTLLGAYNTITNGRDDASTTAGVTSGARSTTDQLYVLGASSYGVATFGYPVTAGHETYPIQFTTANEPSTIKGLTYPTINAGNTTGTIEVTAAYPAGFTVRDYIKHLSNSASHTVLSFANPFGNTVRNNYMASNNPTPASYTGISMIAGAAGQTHTIQDNNINLTDDGTGEAWPGNALISTESIPTTFVGISLSGTAGASPINVICNNIHAASTSGSTGIAFTSAVAASGIVNIETNTIRKMGTGINYTFSAGYGFNSNVTTKENYIIDGTTGVAFNGDLVPMVTNKVFVNNNNLSGNTTGVNVLASTDNTANTTNMLDLRFNWWGSNLGPVKGTLVSNTPSFAGDTDSLKLIGHVPFTHSSGATIEDNSNSPSTGHGRWEVYPTATVATDANGTACGWNYTHIMPAVLRVNATANTLLGAYNTIANGRDDVSSTAGITSGARANTDQLYVLGPSTYGASTFGYPSAPSSVHETYPIVFNAANEPSSIRGLTYPTINTLNSPGAITVGSAFPSGFTIKDYIKHFTVASSHTVLSFANPFGNTVENNFMASNEIGGVGTGYTGISITAGASGQTHTVRYNRVNLTDGASGEAWPGSSNITTPFTTNTSSPQYFTGVSFTGTSGASNINVVCNNFVANSMSGSKGIEYTSAESPSGTVSLEANTIHKMGAGIHYTFSSGFGFTNSITANKNYIVNGNNGVLIEGTMQNNTVNKVFVNNNSLAGNNYGVYLQATTFDNASSTNFIDFRFNWWGSDLGPVRAGSPAEIVGSIPSLASNDSLYLRGYIPFTHTSGSVMADLNTGRGRWFIYPAVTSSIDNNGIGCGWEYVPALMMSPVLRVNQAGDVLLSSHNTITSARNSGTSPTEQIFVIANSTYTGTGDVFGYDGATSNEPAYPVVFSNNATHPATIRGINRPRILGSAAGTGSIEVTAAITSNFVVKDYIEHVGTTSGPYTAISFANAGSNRAENNFITSTHSGPTSFTGITLTNNAAGKTQYLDSNRIKFASNPRWPNGPAVAVSSPLVFKGIEIASHGVNGNATMRFNDISVAPANGTNSVGIYADAVNLNVSADSNSFYGMATDGWYSRTNYWGTGMYLSNPKSFLVTRNNIQGGNGMGNKGHDGITIDRPQVGIQNIIQDNIISTVAPLSGVNLTSTRERGYGIKVYSSTGTDNFGQVLIQGNTIGSASSKAPGVASIYVGGTSGTIAQTDITQNDIKNATASANAAVQIGTTQYSGTATSAAIDIFGNGIGSTTVGESNAMFLAIGTDGIGSAKNAFADNYQVDVYLNLVRTSSQTIGGSTIEVADGRPNRGANIRNIFGYTNGNTLNGALTAGNGNSGKNTFTHAAILTGETGLANYSSTLTRTGNAIAYPANTDPAVISRLIASPLAAATSTDSMNTVELRENAGWNQTSEDLYYKETLTFPDHRILISGPADGSNVPAPPAAATAYAELLPGAGGIGVMFTSVGRENKDIRGSIRFNTIGAGLYGRVAVGAANKGDVYLQMAGIAGDQKLEFNHDGSALASLTAVTGLNNSLVRLTDIKAGMDDADDDSYVANSSTSRRTGVFRSGTSTNQFLKETPNAVAGTELMNVFPNPASGDVTVAFKVPVEGKVSVALFDAMGRKVTDLREDYLTIDTYSTTFNAAELPSGTYHVRLMHDLFTVTTSVTVIK